MFRRTLGCIAAVTLVGALAVGPTTHADQGFMEDQLFYAFHYFDPASGVVVTAGAPVEAFCGRAAPGNAALRIFPRRDGTESLKAHGQRDQAIYVYEYSGTSEGLIDDTCAAYDAEPPTPVATGAGLLKFTVDGIEGPDDIGGYALSNSINGFATSTDGARWKVHASADLDLDETGSPGDDPTEFQQASVRPIGPSGR